MNRIVTLLLRSPLHRLVSGALLLLTVTGRRGDQPITFPVQYAALADDLLVVVAGDAEGKTWWRNLSADEPREVAVVLRGEERTGTARLLRGDDLDEAMVAYLHRFPRTWRLLGVPPDATPEEVGEAARELTAVGIDLS